ARGFNDLTRPADLPPAIYPPIGLVLDLLVLDGRVRHEDAHSVEDVVATADLRFGHILFIRQPVGGNGHRCVPPSPHVNSELRAQIGRAACREGRWASGRTRGWCAWCASAR